MPDPDRRATARQLYNAGIAMNLAERTPEHAARSAAFMALFEHARPWTQWAAIARIAVWRYSPSGQEMRRTTR